MPYNPDSEDALELDRMTLFESLGWDIVRADIEAVLDQSITPKDYIIDDCQQVLDLRRIETSTPWPSASNKASSAPNWNACAEPSASSWTR